MARDLLRTPRTSVSPPKSSPLLHDPSKQLSKQEMDQVAAAYVGRAANHKHAVAHPQRHRERPSRQQRGNTTPAGWAYRPLGHDPSPPFRPLG